MSIVCVANGFPVLFFFCTQPEEKLRYVSEPVWWEVGAEGAGEVCTVHSNSSISSPRPWSSCPTLPTAEAPVPSCLIWQRVKRRDDQVCSFCAAAVLFFPSF